MSVLIVEHHMDVVMSVCDRLYVLNFGEVISSGTADVVRRDPAVIAAYLGASKVKL
jgi:branched-chain amino acid transport system ATP-binding protein